MADPKTLNVGRKAAKLLPDSPHIVAFIDSEGVVVVIATGMGKELNLLAMSILQTIVVEGCRAKLLEQGFITKERG